MQETVGAINCQRCKKVPGCNTIAGKCRGIRESQDAGDTSMRGEGCDMATEKSFLTKIREKELEVSVRIDDVRVEADRAIDRAKKEAQAILTSSETEGKKAADDYLEKEMEQIQAEAERTRREAKDLVDSLLKKGEKNIPKAVEKIIGIMLSG